MNKLMFLVFVGVLASALAGSSTVWAGATFTPVSGTMHYVVVDDGTRWLDEEGILHIRDSIMEWDLLEGEGDFVGTGWGIFNANIDPATGNGDTQGFHYFDVSSGEVSGTLATHTDAIYTGFVMVGQSVGHGGGGFAGMHWRAESTLVFSSGFAEYNGILHDPRGGRGDKAFPTETKSWSSVKALYR